MIFLLFFLLFLLSLPNVNFIVLYINIQRQLFEYTFILLFLFLIVIAIPWNFACNNFRVELSRILYLQCFYIWLISRTPIHIYLCSICESDTRLTFILVFSLVHVRCVNDEPQSDERKTGRLAITVTIG